MSYELLTVGAGVVELERAEAEGVSGGGLIDPKVWWEITKDVLNCWPAIKDGWSDGWAAANNGA